MKTRTRADSLAGPRLNLTWDTEPAPSAPVVPPTPDVSGTPADNSRLEPMAVPSPPTPQESTPDVPQASASEQPSPTGAPLPPPSPKTDGQAEPVRQPAAEPPKPAPPAVHPRRVGNTVDLTRRIEQVGPSLRKFRENLNLTIEDLSKKTLIPRLSIQRLEQGNYAELEELIYCKRHLLLLCRELGIDSADSEQLETLLEKEYAKAGREVQSAPEIKTLEPSWTSEEVTKGRPLSWFQRLPGILLTLALITAVVLLVALVVIPMVKLRDKPSSQRQDWAPLLPVTPPQPLQLQVPGQ
ncbi:MAG: helix-turn-helix domain-containing protein [Victivallales bacterium]|nr:helix-turn-helix domain-containing protein [Victivallales bacterium]